MSDQALSLMGQYGSNDFFPFLPTGKKKKQNYK